MFGFKKSSSQKKQLDELERKYKSTDKMLQDAKARVKDDESLYKWQKQRQLNRLQKMECEQLAKYIDQKRQIKNEK